MEQKCTDGPRRTLPRTTANDSASGEGRLMSMSIQISMLILMKGRCIVSCQVGTHSPCSCWSCDGPGSCIDGVVADGTKAAATMETGSVRQVPAGKERAGALSYLCPHLCLHHPFLYSCSCPCSRLNAAGSESAASRDGGGPRRTASSIAALSICTPVRTFLAT